MPMSKARLAVLLLVMALNPAVRPASATTAVAAVRDLPAVRVEPSHEGAPVWRAARGDRVLAIVGTMTPVPPGIHWRTAETDRLLSRAGAFVMPPNADIRLGLFARLAFIASAKRRFTYPDGRSLADVLSPGDLADLRTANRSFNHGDESVLGYRPRLATMILYSHALEAMGLKDDSPVARYLSRIARARGAEIMRPQVRPKVDSPRKMVVEMSTDGSGETACLQAMVQLLARDPEELGDRAMAWSRGELDRVPMGASRMLRICRAADDSTSLLARHGVVDLFGQLQRAWMAAVGQATGRHAVVASALPINWLPGPNGYFAALRRAGFVITGPTLDLPPGVTPGPHDIPAPPAPAATPAGP